MVGEHTPGPWHWDDRMRRLVGSNGNPIAGQVYFAGTGEHEIDANARLIAAAPDLLRALESALEYIAHAGRWENARVAIAKARGE